MSSGHRCKHALNHLAQEAFRQVSIGSQVRKSDFRLDHPKFREMTAGIGVFRAKGRTKGINLAREQA